MAKAAKRDIPFDFVLEVLAEREPYTKPMFGCTSVYVEDKIVFILRDKANPPEDDGVWIATIPEYHESLRELFPNMKSISIFGPGPTGWQVLPSESSDFEEAVFKACELVLAGDERIGKVPKRKLRKASEATRRSKEKSTGGSTTGKTGKASPKAKSAKRSSKTVSSSSRSSKKTGVRRKVSRK